MTNEALEQSEYELDEVRSNVANADSQLSEARATVEIVAGELAEERTLHQQTMAERDRLAKSLDDAAAHLADEAMRITDLEDERDKVDTALRCAGIEYPLGARGVVDLAAMASGRLEELQGMDALLEEGDRARADRDRLLVVYRAAEAWAPIARVVDKLSPLRPPQRALLDAVDSYRSAAPAEPVCVRRSARRRSPSPTRPRRCPHSAIHRGEPWAMT